MLFYQVLYLAFGLLAVYALLVLFAWGRAGLKTSYTEIKMKHKFALC